MQCGDCGRRPLPPAAQYKALYCESCGVALPAPTGNTGSDTFGKVLVAAAAGVLMATMGVAVVTRRNDSSPTYRAEVSGGAGPGETANDSSVPSTSALPSAPSTTGAPPAAIGATGLPIVQGWVAVIASDFKSPEVMARLNGIAASVPGAVVVDIDDYLTLPLAEAGKAPDFFPRGGTYAAVVAGSFFGPVDVERFCSTRGPGQSCNVRQLLRRSS